jgi:hypothetical protein
MRVLKFAIFTMVCSVLAPVEASDVTYDLDKIETQNGRIYRDILILESDQYGLLFRHAVGIAKIDFPQLSMNLRMLYEPVTDEVTEASGEGGDEVEDAPPFDLSRNLRITVTARNRIEFPINHGDCGCASACHHYRNDWPGHWPRYHPALRLAIPECRALAVKDFLITSGLVARPPGVVTYRLPYNRSYRLY